MEENHDVACRSPSALTIQFINQSLILKGSQDYYFYRRHCTRGSISHIEKSGSPALDECIIIVRVIKRSRVGYNQHVHLTQQLLPVAHKN